MTPTTVARRSAAAVLLVALVILLAPRTVHADPAGPTDYRSEVTSIEPPVDALAARILGGDAFVELSVSPGVTVVVTGYEGEPYVRFEPDGSVFENRRSPAYFYNQERYGADIPAAADAAAAPDWVRVASGGTWAWHDHRAHRMEPFAPLNASRGDEVLDAVIPLIVDDAPVEIHVRSVWMPEPSPVPGLVGAIGGAVLTIGAVQFGRRGARDRSVPTAAILAGIVAAAALVIGGTQFAALPASTDPSWIWWVAPLVALVATVAAVAGDRRPTWRLIVVPGAATLAGVQLVVWGWERRTGIVRAVLPVEVPFWSDRMVTAAALSVGATVALVALVSLIRTVIRPVDASRPAPGRTTVT